MRKIKLIDINSEESWPQAIAGFGVVVLALVGFMHLVGALYHWGVLAYRSLGH